MDQYKDTVVVNKPDAVAQKLKMLEDELGRLNTQNVELKEKVQYLERENARHKSEITQITNHLRKK
jgi:regulator of replication initiation timing